MSSESDVAGALPLAFTISHLFVLYILNSGGPVGLDRDCECEREIHSVCLGACTADSRGDALMCLCIPWGAMGWYRYGVQPHMQTHAWRRCSVEWKQKQGDYRTTSQWPTVENCAFYQKTNPCLWPLTFLTGDKRMTVWGRCTIIMSYVTMGTFFQLPPCASPHHRARV